ncbi:hypothetical protein PMCN03_0949 [Pasteurella multocida subsp. multocida str. HB03]|nr:hypothetical protein PMCN03_0949 [Pasteurella multocida subsp. multocida str. HB03]
MNLDFLLKCWQTITQTFTIEKNSVEYALIFLFTTLTLRKQYVVRKTF